MNIKEELTCKQCKSIYNEPIFLYCCSDHICKEHLSKELSNLSLNKITCPFCSSEIDKHGLNVNKLIQKLVANELHKFKIYPKYKELINNFKSEIDALEKIAKHPENLIYEKFSELKRQVDLDRENSKAKIDDLANEMIEKLETIEKEFKNDSKSKLVSNNFNELIAESKKQLKENEKYVNLFSIENSDREEKSIEANAIITNLKSNRNKLEKDLFCNKSFKYKESSLNIDDFFGKLIIVEEFIGNVKKTFSGHTSTIFSLVELPNGNIVSGSSDNTIREWNVNDATVKKNFSGHTGAIRALLLLEKNLLASASYDFTIRIWNLDDGTVNKTLKGHTNYVHCLALLQNGDLASGSQDNSIIIWNLNDGSIKITLTGHTGAVLTLAVLQNGYLASGSADKTIKIWNRNGGIILKTLEGHTDQVLKLVVLNNGDLVSSSMDKTIKIWNTNDGVVKRSLTGQPDCIHTLLLFRNEYLVSVASDSTIQIWDLIKGEVKKTFKGDAGVANALLELENGCLVSAHANFKMILWE